MGDDDRAHAAFAALAMHALVSQGQPFDVDALARLSWAVADAMVHQLEMRRKTSRPPPDEGVP